MAMTRARKIEHVDEVRATLDAANTVYLVSLSGLTVNEVNLLRTSLREAGASLRVVRNRLALRTLDSDERQPLKEHFIGPTALAHHPIEPITVAKVLTTFAREHPALAIKVGLVEGRQVVDEAGVKSLAELPGLDEIRAMLLSTIMAPATTLVRLISTPSTQMARVMQARSEQES